MKNLFIRLIKKLYFKFAFRTENFANQIALYCFPKKLSKKEVTLIVTQLNEKIELNNAFTFPNPTPLFPEKNFSFETEKEEK